MMQKHQKLTVRRQTIRTLGALDLAQARGGQRDTDATCVFETDATCARLGAALPESEATCVTR